MDNELDTDRVRGRVGIQLIAILAVSCGQINTAPPNPLWDNRLVVHLNQYIEDLAKRGINTDTTALLELLPAHIRVKGTDDLTGLGACIQTPVITWSAPNVVSSKRIELKVYISPTRLGDWATVYHELGHCLHGLRHSTDLQSLMYDVEVYPSTWYNFHREELIDKLVEQIKEERNSRNDRT